MLKKRVLTSLCAFVLATSLLFSAIASRKPQNQAPNAPLSPQVATVIINEFLADPAAGATGDANGDGTPNTTQDEFIELVNNGGAPVDISGFTVSDALQVRFTVPAGKIIPAGESAVVFGGGTPTGPFGNAGANGLVFSAGGAGLSLNNTGDTITVKDATTAVVATLTYGAEANADQSITRSPDITGGFVTHSTAAGSGGSLFSPGARVSGSPFTTTDPVITSISPDATVAGSGDLPLTVNGSNFQAASQVRVDGSPIATMFGTTMTLSATIPAAVTNVPGSHAVTVANPGPVVSNSVTFTVLGAVGINEYLADPPDGIAGDANGDGTRDAAQDEFVEVINRTSAAVNVGGFSISDADSVRFTFPSGTMIPASEAAVIFGGGTPTGNFGNANANGLVFTSSLSLNNGGDTITLKDALSATIESITFGATEGNANQSITRSPDVTGGFVTHSTAAGSGGSLFSPGTLVNGSPFTTPNPIISSISPNQTTSGSGDVPITVNGSNFQAAAQVRVDGSPVATTFGTAMLLNATIPASVTSVPGPHAVTVANPGPVVSNSVTFSVLGAVGINEYLADPADGLAGDANGDGVRDSSQDEFVEVINRTNAAINVGGYSISDADSVRFTFPSGTMIPANEAAVIFGGGTPTGEFGNAQANGLVFTSVLSLNNGGDTITLKDALNATIESITFGSTEGNADQSITRSPDVTGGFVTHSTATGSGGRLFSPGTLVNGSPFTTPNPVINSISPNGAVAGSGDVPVVVTGLHYEAASQVRVDGVPVATMFQSSMVLNATIPASVTSTPGSYAVTVVNPGPRVSNAMPFTVLGALGINEYLADPPDGIAGDANGDGVRDSSEDEFVEVINRTNAAVNVGGYTISDADSVRFTFPSGTIIPANEAAVIFGGGTPTGEFGNAQANGLVFTSALSLNNGGDTITLKDALNATLESIIFGATEGNANQSITRSPDVSGGFVTHSTATGSGGRLFSPGTLVNGNPFTAPNPVINSISPSGTVAGSGDVPITVTGAHYEAASQVRVNGVPIATMFQSATVLNATIPASVTSTPGAYAVTVENPGPRVSNAVPFTVLATLGINEYLADPPDGLAGDANGDGVRDSSDDEFVEIVNRTGAPMAVGGFTIRDADAQRFTFPSGTIIPAGEAAVIFGGGAPTGDFGNAQANGLVFKASLSLNNGGDTITLKDDLGTTIESIIFGSTEGNANQSINRNPDVTGVAFATHSSVPGSGGRLFSPGALVNGSPFTAGPRITSIAPDSVNKDAPSFDMVVLGSGFEGTSTVLIDGSAIGTTFVNSNHLTAHVPESVTAVSGPHPVQVSNAGGNRSNPVTLTIIPPAPILQSITPKVVIVGGGAFTMFLTGLNFAPGTAVLIDGTAVATTFLTVVDLKATVPASFTTAVATHVVVVRNSDGKLSNSATLDVIPAATVITSISPSTAIAGGPSFSMLVRGTNFKNNAAVVLGGTDLATTFRSQSELTAEVPASLIATPRVHAVSVRNPNESPSNEAVFQVFPNAPVIESLDPPSVIEGSGEVTVTISGQRFQPGAKVRNIEATQRGAALDTTFVSAERLQAKVPAVLTQTSGSVALAVENPDLGLSNTLALKVFIKDPLVINEYLADPADGLAGDANGDGTRSSSADEFVEIVNRSREPFDISGYKLFDADEVRHVFAAGTIVPPFEAVVVFGGGTPTGAFGNATDNHMVFKASTGGLSLNNGGDTISLQDAQGHVVQEIKFGAAEGGAGQSINRDPDADGATFARHSIVAADGSRLFSPGAKATGQTFTIKPGIVSITPATVHVGSVQFTLTVSGSKFLPGAVVLLGNTALVTVFRSETQLEAQVPANLVAEGGGLDVRVKNPRGELSGTARLLIADDPPRILAITPKTTGTGAENLQVSVAGERFQRGASVKVQGKAVETSFVSSTSLVAILPSALFEKVAELPLLVLNADGNSSNAVTLTVENGPLITRLSRSKIRSGGGVFELTVGGVAFKPGVILFANDVALSTTFISDSSFTARIPAELTSQPGVLQLQARHPDGGRSNNAKFKVKPSE